MSHRKSCKRSRPDGCKSEASHFWKLPKSIPFFFFFLVQSQEQFFPIHRLYLGGRYRYEYEQPTHFCFVFQSVRGNYAIHKQLTCEQSLLLRVPAAITRRSFWQSDSLCGETQRDRKTFFAVTSLLSMHWLWWDHLLFNAGLPIMQVPLVGVSEIWYHTGFDCFDNNCFINRNPPKLFRLVVDGWVKTVVSDLSCKTYLEYVPWQARLWRDRWLMVC